MCPTSAESSGATEDLWKLYFHDPADRDWTHASYRVVAQMSSAGELNGVHAHVGDRWGCGMFFLMREHVFPAWDDPANLQGGCMCLKIPKTAVADFWYGVCARLMGETLVRPALAALSGEVCGVSVSPKNFFCIVKLWLASPRLAESGVAAFDFPDFDGEMLYKPNNEQSQRFVAERMGGEAGARPRR